MEFHDNYPQYELMAHHSEDVGKVARKKLWRVFWIMLGITIIELGVGFSISVFPKPLWYIILFLIFTVFKAYFIVFEFMHLGHEVKGMKWTIVAPFTMFVIYLTWIISTEGSYNSNPAKKLGMDPHVIHQIQEQRAGHGHEGSAPEETNHGPEGEQVH